MSDCKCGLYSKTGDVLGAARREAENAADDLSKYARERAGAKMEQEFAFICGQIRSFGGGTTPDHVQQVIAEADSIQKDLDGMQAKTAGLARHLVAYQAAIAKHREMEADWTGGM